MNLLVEKGIISEMDCGTTSFAYLLQDNALFVSTEYKVLQSQSNGCFVRCMKMMYNGKIQLYYLTNGAKSLSTMLQTLDAEHFLTVTKNLLSGIIDVKNNGFLSCKNIDSSFDHIYVDPNTYKVGLVYLPITAHEYEDDAAFESAMRTNLVRTLSAMPALSSAKTAQLSVDLQNGMISIAELNARIGGKVVMNTGRRIEERKPVTPPPAVGGGAVMRMIAMNAPNRVELLINKPDYTIGKKETNDGIVDFNKMISRVHCRIIRNGNSFSILDQQSANGTFVNGVRLAPAQPCVLHNGDIVRLANSDFQVEIRG